MWWALFAFLSCIVTGDHSYAYNINAPIQTFVVGQPYKNASWRHPPEIRVCSDTKVTAFRINHAVSYWQKLGYKFGSVSVDNSINCTKAYYGEILITLPDSSFDNTKIASTRIYSKISTDEIVKAKIFIMPKDSKKARVLEHEIGHALGWAHYNKKFHIMHSNWIMGGLDASGLQNDG
tara:strand:+ start:369 stop:902 length:534 start_codon:yes stop_codon:yes gene_type:complete